MYTCVYLIPPCAGMHMYMEKEVVHKGVFNCSQYFKGWHARLQPSLQTAEHRLMA